VNGLRGHVGPDRRDHVLQGFADNLGLTNGVGPQRLTDEQQIAYGLNFGELESYKTAAYVKRADGPRLGTGMADLSNLNRDGTNPFIQEKTRSTAYRSFRITHPDVRKTCGRSSTALSPYRDRHPRRTDVFHVTCQTAGR
jgi:hypothetical protein